MMIYAIGVESKRHAIYTKGAPLGTEDFRLVEADADGWIPWHGRKIEGPLPKDSLFDIRMRDGEHSMKIRAAWWGHSGELDDVIAYRPILDEPEVPEWDGDELDSERAANARLTEELEQVKAERDEAFAKGRQVFDDLRRVEAERDALVAYVEAAKRIMHRLVETERYMRGPRPPAVQEFLDWVDAEPTTNLARLKPQWQAEVLEETGRYVRCEEDAALLRINAQELRRQAEMAGAAAEAVPAETLAIHKEALEALEEQVAFWRDQCHEARADDRRAMAYLEKIRAAVGPDLDFPGVIAAVEDLVAKQGGK